jgi:thiol-disulfide isomerase/thioredoxin
MNSVDSEGTTDRTAVRRRGFLGALGTAVATGLAGCSGGSSPSGTPGATTGTVTPDESLALPSVVAEGDLPDGRVELVREGTVTFLNFFATWCKPCQDEMPDLRRLRAEYAPDRLHMVSITPEVDDQLVREFWAEYEGTWPVVKDPALRATERWNANSYPTNLLFDRDGTPATGDSPEVRARSFDEIRALVDPLVGEA